MGYSARYHAASLAAVFLALAVGILVGVGFGSDIVTGTAEDLEGSLEGDLDAARERIEGLEGDLEGEREFQRTIYPTVVGETLRGDQVALVGLGGLSAEVIQDVEDALGPSGAEIAEVAVVKLPPDLDALARTLEGRRRSRALSRGEPEELEALGVDAARLLVHGGSRFDELRGTLLGRYSGEAGGIDAVLVVRERPDDLEPGQEATTDELENGLAAGLRSLGVPAVGVERSDTDPSTVEFFDSRGLTTVDSVDRVSGKVAMVFALCGAQGTFGAKQSADALLPDLLEQPCLRLGRETGSQPGVGSLGQSEAGESP
jgi:hypothetical protein